MAKLVLVSVFILVSSFYVTVTQAGTIAYKHRDTTLDELRSIDSFVSSALPVLRDGFFIGTSNGPVLVKSESRPAVSKKPTVSRGYYRTLPRLIPAGFEGIATSYFNLGAASPIQPFAVPKTVINSVPVATATHVQPTQYITTQVAQPTEQYAAHPVADPAQLYLSQPQVHQQPQQYSPEIEQAQQYAVEAQQSQQYAAEAQQSQQYAAEAQQSQQYAAQPQQQPLDQPEVSQSVQEFQQYEQPQQHQQYLVERSAQQQQYFPEQDINEAQLRQAPQESAQIPSHSQFSTQDSQPSFQVDNLLRPEQEPAQVATYQTQLFGEERYHSQKLLANAEVIANSEFEETLPATLKNQFYKSANLATILAQESLPVQGEQIVGEWDTNKIAKGKIHALLHGAGFI